MTDSTPVAGTIKPRGEHALKIDVTPMDDLMSGAKTGEVRRDDRGFQVGDIIHLTCADGRKATRTISHIQRGYGLPDGICVLSYVTPANATDTAEQAIHPLERKELFSIIHGLTDTLAALRAENERLTADKDAWIEQYRNIQKLEKAHRDLRQKAEDERDRLQTELARVTTAVKDLRDIFSRNVTDSGNEPHRLFLDGKTYTGPAVDFLHRLATAVMGVCDKALNRAALSDAQKETGA